MHVRVACRARFATFLIMRISELALLDDLSTWRLFLKVCRMGSFAAAARSSGMSASALGRRMAKLEATLGIRLFNRSGIEVAPTPEAQQLLETVGEILNRFDSALSKTVDRSELNAKTDTLRLSAPCCLMEHLFAPWLSDFQAAHPHLQVQLLIRETADDPDRSDCDIAVHCGATTIGSERTVRIGAFRRIMAASPSYLERTGTPKTIEELRSKRLFHYNGAMCDTIWLWKDGKRHRAPTELASLCASTTGPLMGLVLEGKGIVLSTAVFMCANELRDGKLVQVLPEYKEADKPVSFMLHSERSERPLVKEAVDFLREKWKDGEGLSSC